MWELNVRSELRDIITGSEGSTEAQSYNIRRYLTARHVCKSSVFCFCISLTLSDKTDRRQWGCLFRPVSSSAQEDPVSITPSCPWAALSPSVLTPAPISSHILFFHPFDPSHHSVSLPYSQLLYAQRCVYTHTHTHTQTHSDRPGIVCVTWGELPHWEQQHWMGLIVTLTGICPSGWLAWITGTMNPVSQTSVAVDAAFFFFPP